MYLYDFDNKSMKLIIKIADKFNDLVQAEMLSADLKPSYHNILSAVYFRNGANQYALARDLNLKAPSISVTLRNLEAVDLVKRKIDPFDGRATKVYLTERGFALEERIKVYEDKLMEGFLADFTEDERFRLIELLERIDKTDVSGIKAGEEEEEEEEEKGKGKEEESEKTVIYENV